jgi:hypothetical protein
MPVDDPNPNTYRCYWCGAAELKHKWGPGMITCPHCKRIAPSPSETMAIEAEEDKVRNYSILPPING